MPKQLLCKEFSNNYVKILKQLCKNSQTIM